MGDIPSSVERKAMLAQVRHLREEARDAGLKSYNPNVPCAHGHLASRFVSSNACCECGRLNQKRMRQDPAFRAKDNKRRAAHYFDNHEYYIEYNKDYSTKNVEGRRKNRKKWETANPDKAAKIQDNYRKTSVRYKLQNRANASAHHKRCKHATPPWQSQKELRSIHALRPRGYVVDHRIPLRHKTICGLNVRGNLQYLTRSANSAKSNKWPYSESFDSSAIVPFSWEHFLVISEQA